LFPSSTITLDAALRDLARGGARARAFAARALGDVTEAGERRRAVEGLIAALADDLPQVRSEAAGSLGTLREPAALPALIKRLDDAIPEVRQHAAIALGAIGHPDGFAPLANALAGGPADLRFQAATSLAEIDAARAFEPLTKALDDRDPQVVSAAALSLGASGDRRALELLAAKLAHADTNTRFDVAYALAELGDARGRSVLAAAVTDAERAWDAVTALKTLGTTDEAEALGRAITGKGTPAEASVLAAGALLGIAQRDGASSAGHAHHDAARKALLGALASRKGNLRGLAIEQLALVGGAWAKAPLEKLARGGKGADFAEAITQALEAIAARDKEQP
jgi:HEAT repeat protein